ncbi:MAG: thiamine-phosphate kinase [Candidatus Latescibacterota bacterium]|nr:thiamine-phosphate kinase [Candidatus Latescibacterota bacterium]
MTRLKDLGEFELIDLITHQVPSASGRLLQGIGDDCAVIIGERDVATLVTVDTMVEGIHFDLSTSTPEGVGSKLLAVNLSDIAAMGGLPYEAFLAISAPAEFDANVIERIAGGIQVNGARFGVQIAGGDTTSTRGPLVLSLTLIGACARDEVVYRSGARPGDSIYVTGTLGNSAAGLLLARDSKGFDSAHRTQLLRRHNRPEPRVSVGRELASKRIATSMIDVSDGLGADLRHVCKLSGVDMIVDPTCLPVSDSLVAFCEARGLNPAEFALTGGEDYELAFTTGKSDPSLVLEAVCPLTCIGKVMSGPGSVRVGSEVQNEVFKKKGFDHFFDRK